MNIGQGRNPVTILLEKQSVLKWKKRKKSLKVGNINERKFILDCLGLLITFS